MGLQSHIYYIKTSIGLGDGSHGSGNESGCAMHSEVTFNGGRMVRQCSVLIKTRSGNELKRGASEEILLPLLCVCEANKVHR